MAHHSSHVGNCVINYNDPVPAIRLFLRQKNYREHQNTSNGVFSVINLVFATCDGKLVEASAWRQRANHFNETLNIGLLYEITGGRAQQPRNTQSEMCLWFRIGLDALTAHVTPIQQSTDALPLGNQLPVQNQPQQIPHPNLPVGGQLPIQNQPQQILQSNLPVGGQLPVQNQLQQLPQSNLPVGIQLPVQNPQTIGGYIQILVPLTAIHFVSFHWTLNRRIMFFSTKSGPSDGLQSNATTDGAQHATTTHCSGGKHFCFY